MPRPSAQTKLFLCRTKLFLSQTKNFVPGQKVHICFGRGQKKTFQLWKKFCPWLKSFSIHFTSKYVFFRLRTKFFVQDKKYFVQAEGRGITFKYHKASCCCISGFAIWNGESKIQAQIPNLINHFCCPILNCKAYEFLAAGRRSQQL